MHALKILTASAALCAIVSCSTSAPNQSQPDDASAGSEIARRDKFRPEVIHESRQSESDSAVYQVTFMATWSAESHPSMFPAGAHWSGLVGATHTAQTSLWMPGQLASAGIERMAEQGAKFPLLNEVDTMIMLGTAATRLSGPGAATPDTVSMIFTIRASHPLVSLVTMVAPSPDWFTGVNSLSLRSGESWVNSLCVDLYGWDAGSDHGTTYGAGDIEANPHQPINQLTTSPFLVNGEIPIVGRFLFERIDQPAF